MARLEKILCHGVTHLVGEAWTVGASCDCGMMRCDFARMKRPIDLMCPLPTGPGVSIVTPNAPTDPETPVVLVDRSRQAFSHTKQTIGADLSPAVKGARLQSLALGLHVGVDCIDPADNKTQSQRLLATIDELAEDAAQCDTDVDMHALVVEPGPNPARCSADQCRRWAASMRTHRQRLQAQRIAEFAPLRLCLACGTCAERMMMCTRCREAHYCDRRCQAAGWPEHKRICERTTKVD